MRHRLAIALVAFVLAVSPLRAQTGKSFMWKVEGEGGNIAYLLGSLHVLTPEWYPLNATINNAFTGSRILIEELLLDEASDPTAMMSAMMKAMLTDGRTLDQVISPQLYADVKRRAEQTGMPMMAIQRMKPWLVAITLMAPTLQNAGFTPELGVDRHFYDRAQTSGMKVQGLETLAYQLDRFDQMSPKLQEEMLKSTIEDLDKEVAGIKDMAKAWGTGDVVAMEKMMLDGLKQSPELYTLLLVERNNNWMPHVEACVKQNSGCFIVVGAAHLVGPDGLPAMLAKKGYRVTQQ
ncbi:MAG TPA: TraB/GumN family protein [Vicinamibacterales bacterium]